METSFVSAVVYVRDQTRYNESKIKSLADELRNLFMTYEIILIDDACVTLIVKQLVNALAGHPVSIVRMGIPQGIDAAMNAGIDAAVGDYVYEIDDLPALDVSFIGRSFKKAKSGVDIINGVSINNSSRLSSLFYAVFNHFSGYAYKITSNPCRLVSRRAINRVRSLSSYAPYRKASYAASGMRIEDVPVTGELTHQTSPGMAITSLALYTPAFYRFAFILAAAMAILSFAELIYVILIAISGLAITGWITTMFALTVGFLGIFILLAFALKYLDILVRITFERQGYITDGIERPDIA